MTRRHRWTLGLGLVVIATCTLSPLSSLRPLAVSPAAAAEETAAPAAAKDSADGEDAPPYDTPPLLIGLHGAVPEYPADAARDRVSGCVEVQLFLESDGSIARLEAVREVPGYPSLTESAIAAIRQWEFAPATRKDQPVPCTLLVPVSFAAD